MLFRSKTLDRFFGLVRLEPTDEVPFDGQALQLGHLGPRLLDIVLPKQPGPILDEWLKNPGGLSFGRQKKRYGLRRAVMA